MARGLLMLSPAMATTATAMVLDTVTATMADTATTMARGLPTLSPAMATTDTAMVLDTVTATMAATMGTTMARGLLRPSLRLPLPLLPRLMLSPAMATTDTASTATVTVWATVSATT